MTINPAITRATPAHLRSTIRSATLTGGIATIIADGGGLGDTTAQELKTALVDALAGVDGIDQVRVALMADRTAGSGSARGLDGGGSTSQRASLGRRNGDMSAPVIVAIGSGKGGVGKSTLTANLAVALAQQGRRVGVIDADIYGPSQVMLLDPQGIRPEARDGRLVPVKTAHGVALLSMAQLIEPDKAIAWRGPMIGKALAQLVEAHWDDADLILVDLPPGTGDVQITLMQRFRPAGAVIVTTPQDLALIDATRALDLFRQAQIPVIGMVENMAGYACPHCGETSDPFGAGARYGGAQAAADKLGERFLGRVPLAPAIRGASDAGTPAAAAAGAEADVFADIARELDRWLERNSGSGAFSNEPDDDGGARAGKAG